MEEELRPLAERWCTSTSRRKTPALIRAVGEGAEQAAQGVETLLREERIECLIVIGIAAGLCSDLEVGDVVAPREVVSRDETSLTPAPGWLERIRGCDGVTEGVVLSGDRIVATGRAKAELWERWGSVPGMVYDLESYACAAVAVRHNVPWAVVRIVSDRFDEDLPMDFDRFEKGGAVSRWKVGRHAVARPWLWPRLLELRRRVDRSASRLADVVAEVLQP